MTPLRIVIGYKDGNRSLTWHVSLVLMFGGCSEDLEAHISRVQSAHIGRVHRERIGGVKGPAKKGEGEGVPNQKIKGAHIRSWGPISGRQGGPHQVMGAYIR